MEGVARWKRDIRNVIRQRLGDDRVRQQGMSGPGRRLREDGVVSAGLELWLGRSKLGIAQNCAWLGTKSLSRYCQLAREWVRYIPRRLCRMHAGDC
jgi:hypothetical protein